MTKKGRRSKGEGSIAQRADGSWQYAIDLGKDSEGKRRRKYLYARTRSALLRKVTDETAKGGGSIQPRAKGTVGEWVDHWLRDDVKPNRSANTYALYESIWRVHAAPLLAALQLEKLDVVHVERLYSELRRGSASSAVLHRVGTVLSRAIQVAIRRRGYFRVNPFAIVDKPRHRAKEAKILTIEQARRLLMASAGTQYEALWVLLLTSGLRLGEALGIEWSDLDANRRTLSVRQGVTEVNGISVVGPLKTRSSRRLVEIGNLAAEALRRRRTDARREGHGSGFIFTTPAGTHPKRSNLRQRYFNPLCHEVGISGVTIHGLRHSMTSLALAEGVAAKVVAERLGHSTVRLTQDRYQHVLPGLQRKAADAIDALLGAEGGEA